MEDSLALVFVMGASVSVIAAAVTSLVTYRAFSDQGLAKEDVLRHSLRVGLITLACFLALTIFLAWFLDYIIGGIARMLGDIPGFAGRQGLARTAAFGH